MLAQNLNSSVRDTGTFVRWGGEEFVILFPETTLKDSVLVCDKLRNMIENLSHKTAGKITASFDLTQYKKMIQLKQCLKDVMMLYIKQKKMVEIELSLQYIKQNEEL